MTNWYTARNIAGNLYVITRAHGPAAEGSARHTSALASLKAGERLVELVGSRMALGLKIIL